MKRILVLLSTVILTGCAVTPHPLQLKDIEQRVDSDLQEMFSGQEQIVRTVTMHEAMARALRHNLNYKLSLMERTLAQQNVHTITFDMLPKLTASAGYFSRSNEQGSSSVDLEGENKGVRGLASTSQEKSYATTDLAMMWNVLDFGLTYLRAKQEADQVLITEERKRKAVHNIMEEVRFAYWQAVGSKELIAEMNELLAKAQAALDTSVEIEKARLQPTRQVLDYQRDLLESMRLLWEMIRNLQGARTRLATLMNLPPGTDFTLHLPQWESLSPAPLAIAENELVRIALLQRPELREEDYRARITGTDYTKTMLEMLPGLQLRAGLHSDSNDYLYNNQWFDAGVSLSLNILNIFSRPAALKAIKTRKGIDTMRRKVGSAAIMTQVHLACQEYAQNLHEYDISDRLAVINTKLQAQSAAERKSGSGNELSQIRQRLNALVTQMRRNMAYAKLQNAKGRIYSSIGEDFIPDDAEPTESATFFGARIARLFKQADKKLFVPAADATE